MARGGSPEHEEDRQPELAEEYNDCTDPDEVEIAGVRGKGDMISLDGLRCRRGTGSNYVGSACRSVT